ncbi:helicase HerA domain-containing protein [Fontibacillus sp. BL9]|uniref:helicase HerA domain-containing protein n=1 Tax=Fontibacillus sp. BL9 TaxID=3389971 RepID=UPI00397E1FD4
MELLVVSGGFHGMVRGYFTRKMEPINSNGLELRDLADYLQHENPVMDGVLITDEAFAQRPGQDRDHLTLLLEWIEAGRKPGLPVLIVTRDHLKPQELAPLMQKFGNLKLVIYPKLRIPPEIFQDALVQLGKKGNDDIHTSSKTEHKRYTETLEQPDAGQPEKKRSFFDRFRAKPETGGEPEATDRLTRDLLNVSRGISRVVAVTGHRGSGLTTTVVNLAHEASKRGLSTIIIDMDTEYRSTNMYFDRFHERTNKDEQMSASLIRTLARPQEYMTTAFNIKDNFWLTGLGYSFHDRKLMEQFYTTEKLIGLISVLRSKFNLVLLDMPLDLFRNFKEVMIHIDLFGLCVPNNLYAVLSTIRNVEVVLDPDKASYLNAKSKVIVTKYNDRSRFQDSLFEPDKVSELLTSGLSDYFRYEMKTAGAVPYSPGFDSQIESDIALTNAGAEYEKAFGQLLLRLMEGA